MAPTRRRFLESASALSAASLLGYARMAAAEPPPEVTGIRILYAPALCFAPEFLAEEFLKMEGFSAVEYVPMHYGTDAPSLISALAEGVADVATESATSYLPVIDAGKAVKVLSGIHAGCLELFGNDRVRSIRELRGKSVVIIESGAPDHLFVAALLAYVGIDPRKEVKWVAKKNYSEMVSTFAKGEADAILAFPPMPQELRRMNLGHVILDATQDRPWSQYFCCMFAGRTEFVNKHPIATKRALRAILKATDLCAQDPERAARLVVAKKFDSRYDLTLEVLRGLPYRRWREADPEDTLRFLALRLHEVGMIKTSPQKAHRPRHRLALLERTQEGIEGVSALRSRRFEHTSRLGEPVQRFQTRHAGEFTNVGGRNPSADAHSMRGDQQIVVADGPAGTFERGPDRSIGGSRGDRIVQQLEARKKFFQGDRVLALLCAFVHSVAQLTRGDRRQAELSKRAPRQPAQYPLEAWAAIDEMDTDVSVEQGAHQNLRDCAGGFSARSIGLWKPSNTASRSSKTYRLGSRSIPLPWRRTTTSSSSKRNSFGNLTAWLLPCRNIFAVFMSIRALIDTESIYSRPQGSKPPLVGWWRPLAAPLLALMLGIGIAPAFAHRSAREARLPSIGAAPAFTLTDIEGKKLSLADLRGRVVALTFIFTSCADTCPVLTAKLVGIQRKLKSEMKPQVFFAAITVDPERDTPEALRRYAQSHGADPAHWAFLTGSPAEIKEVTQRYGIFHKKQPQGEVDHTFLTSLIDKQGTLRVQYLGWRFRPAEFTEDLRALVKEEARK